MTQNLPPLSFQHVAPELRLYCGADSIAALVRELKRSGCQRAVVVAGNSVGSSTAMDLLRGALGEVLVGESHAVKTNSPVAAVEEVTGALREFAADAVVAVGGGSAAVTARAASVLLAEGKTLQELCTRRQPDGEFLSPRLPAAKLPQFVLPTTPSTAFVKAGSAAHDPATGERLAIFDPKTRATAVFIHPAFLATSPLELTRSASLNTLSTAVEALESPKCDPVSEAMLMHSVRLTSAYVGELSSDATSVRERLAIAGVLCGRGTEQAGGGLASVLAHATGHRVHVANGIINAIVLPHTMRFNAPATAGTAARIVESLTGPPSSGAARALDTASAVDRLEALFGRVGVPLRLRDIGVAERDLAQIAEAAMADWFINRAPRRVSGVADLRGILERAW
jgi:alcohol dehydrogenase class IV